MKLTLWWCPTCNEESSDGLHGQDTELLDDLFFVQKCPRGHETALVAANQKFEILFESGVTAVLDGYGREAVSSFAASLERFHEFCIKVFAVRNSVPRDRLLAAWKMVSSQSERQLGAFIFLHLLHLKAPPVMDESRVTFRNAVIHKGKLTKIAEAEDYGKYAFDYIVGMLKKMKPLLDGDIEQVQTDDVSTTKSRVKAGIRVREVAFPTMINLANKNGNFGALSFEEALRLAREEHLGDLERRVADLETRLQEEEDASDG